MRTLEVEFEGRGEVSGTMFKQIEKSDKAFVYELSDPEVTAKRYEVFERKIQKESEMTIGGQTIKYEQKELYPKANHFGVWAWAIHTRERAMQKFYELNISSPALKGEKE